MELTSVLEQHVTSIQWASNTHLLKRILFWLLSFSVRQQSLLIPTVIDRAFGYFIDVITKIHGVWGEKHF